MSCKSVKLFRPSSGGAGVGLGDSRSRFRFYGGLRCTLRTLHAAAIGSTLKGSPARFGGLRRWWRTCPLINARLVPQWRRTSGTFRGHLLARLPQFAATRALANRDFAPRAANANQRREIVGELDCGRLALGGWCFLHVANLTIVSVVCKVEKPPNRKDSAVLQRRGAGLRQFFADHQLDGGLAAGLPIRLSQRHAADVVDLARAEKVEIHQIVAFASRSVMRPLRRRQFAVVVILEPHQARRVDVVKDAHLSRALARHVGDAGAWIVAQFGGNHDDKARRNVVVIVNGARSRSLVERRKDAQAAGRGLEIRPNESEMFVDDGHGVFGVLVEYSMRCITSSTRRRF